jgi:hypothetical protein
VSDDDAIIATVRDYWEGWFSGDAGRMERALHPQLTKTGVVADGTRSRVTQPMRAADMIGWTAAGEGVAERPADFAYDIAVVDRHNGIATATVRSAIYREYLHLVETAEGWRIMNALYTSA